MTRAYVLTSIEGLHLSSLNIGDFFDELNLPKFLAFSATLFGLYINDKIIEYRFGDYLCNAIRIPTTNFSIIVLSKLDSSQKSSINDANISIFISFIMMHYLSCSLFFDSFVLYSNSIKDKCILYNETVSAVTNLNSDDIVKYVQDDIQSIQDILSHLEEHYLYEWLKLPHKLILDFESVRLINEQPELQVLHYHFSCTKWKSDNTNYKSCLVPRLYYRIVPNNNQAYNTTASAVEEYIIQISTNVSVDKIICNSLIYIVNIIFLLCRYQELLYTYYSLQ